MDRSWRERELKDQVQGQRNLLEEAKERESDLKRKTKIMEKKYEREKGDVDEKISYIQSMKEEIYLAMKREL